MKIYSPLNGKVKDLFEVDDVAFSKKLLGDGIAIVPSDGELVAPADAKVEMVFPTKHAIGLTTTDGVELLIHIGIDTVNLEGAGFETFVRQGDQVRKGNILIKFDINKIKEIGYSIDTMIIVSNTNNFSNIKIMSTNDIQVGDYLLCVE